MELKALYKINFSAGLSYFYKPCSKKFGHSIWVSILTHGYKYTFGYDTIGFSKPGYYNFSAVTFSNYIIHILGNLQLVFLQFEWS